MGISLGILRFLAFVFFTAIMILLAVMASLIFGTDIGRSISLRREWARMMVFLLGGKIEFRGKIIKERRTLTINSQLVYP